MRRLGLALAVLMLPLPLWGQQSAHFTITEGVLSNGGASAAGLAPSSASFRVSLLTLGATSPQQASSSASFGITGGFVAMLRPPGEVGRLEFTDDESLTWSPEPSAGTYNVYRDPLIRLALGEDGTCWRTDLDLPATTDDQTPASGQAVFYLITVDNLVGEEGTKGTDTQGSERDASPPCP